MQLRKTIAKRSKKTKVLKLKYFMSLIKIIPIVHIKTQQINNHFITNEGKCI